MPSPGPYLSKREQQIMELIHARGELAATELGGLLPGAPSNATVRTLLRILEAKGHLGRREEDGRFVYFAVESREAAARTALDRLVETLFRGSVGEVVAALLREERGPLPPDEIERLQALIEEAKRER